MRFRVRSLLCLGAMFIGVPLAFAQGTTLQYRWAKGEEVRYRFDAQGHVSMSGLAGLDDITMDHRMVEVIRLTVQDVTDNGVATLRQTFESLRMEMTSPVGSMVIDSQADAPGDSIAAGIRPTVLAMIGESVTIILAPTGTVLNVEGASRLVEKAMKSLPEDPMAASLFGQLKDSMSDEAIRRQFEQVFFAFPDHAVKIGETWNGQYRMPNPIMGTLTATKISTLDGVESRDGTSIARISMKIAFRQDAEPNQLGPMGMAPKIGDWKGAGEIFFDVGKGRVQKISFTSDMPLTMSMTGPDGDQITAHSRVRSTSTVEIVNK